jgi:hypothetical protein
MARNTTGNLSSLMQGTESILKFGKANLVIYYCQKIGEWNKNHPKTTRKLINYLTGRASKTKHINEIEIDDKIILRNEENISEAFNEFFINITI